jgi:hypothetical protein
MKSYPTISYNINSNIFVYAFDKLDGSCIRAEWETKKGFWKFGTRRRLLTDDEFLGKAINLIKEKYEKDLTEIFYLNKYGRVLCFFEFWGTNSFAGQHKEDEEHTVTLLDVNPYKKGILPPNTFIKLFGHLDIPNIVYRGKVTISFIEKIRDHDIPGMTYEGVVCKGMQKNCLVMFKLKSKDWLKRVKGEYGIDSDLLDRTERLLINTKQYRQRRFCPNCFRNGSLSPICKCGEKVLSMPYEAQPPRRGASKIRWRNFFNKWYPDLNFQDHWPRKV